MYPPPVWLLDVDGVVNATRPGWSGPPRRALVWSRQENENYQIRWAPALVQRIRELHLGGVVEVRWCTTWCADAEQLELLWRLPPLRRAIVANPMPRGRACWPLKRAAAYAALAEDRSLIWTDDEAIASLGADRERLDESGRALFISPRPNRGLQPNDLDRIESFARAE